MKSDVKLIDLNTLDINTLELPKESFSCYILCNNALPNKEFLRKFIQTKVKYINASGKFSGVWEKDADDVCIEYNNNGKRPDDWRLITKNSKLDSFIFDIAFAHCEYYDDEALSHDPIIFFYDDNNLANFIMKRVEWLLEDTKTHKSLERIELSAHTNNSKLIGISSVQDLIHEVNVALGQDCIAITDHNSTQSLIEAYKISKDKRDFKVLYGINTESNNLNNINLISRNANGKKTINKYLSRLLTKDNKKLVYKGTNGINFLTTERQKIIDDNRDNLLIGLPFYSQALKYALSNESWINEIHKDIAECDYIEVAPLGTYKLFDPSLSDEDLKKAIKLLIDVAKKEDKLVVAVSSPYYANDNKYLEFSILWEHEKDTKLPENYYGHLYSTEEMRYAFDWLNDDDLVEEIVVTNTHKIADMCEDFDYIDEAFHQPSNNQSDDYKELEIRTTSKLHEIYGANVDSFIQKRYDVELKYIKDNNTASIYMLTARVIDETKEEGYANGTRGSIGATLIAFLLGITKCNPLPPHSVCPKCHEVIWYTTVADGFDIKPEPCSKCGTMLKVDGHDIPYETFMGINGDKLPDIDINLAPEFRKKVINVIKKVAPNNSVYRAGTILSIPHIEATKMVNDFAGDGEEIFDNETKEDMAEVLQNTTVNQGLHPGGYFIVPNEIDINDYTPLDSVDGIACTHNAYYDLSNYLYKGDFLEHEDPQTIKFFTDNGIKIEEIDILDPKVLELFTLKGSTDITGIPEFGNNEIMKKVIKKVKPNNFSDLVKISTLLHGTGTWNNNGEILFEQRIPLKDLIGSRDDVFNTLIEYGIDRKSAYEAMENVRKGRGLSKYQENLLIEYKLPKWFIKSCNNIKYLFPKAHAVEYTINALMIAWVKVYRPDLFYEYYGKLQINSK